MENEKRKNWGIGSWAFVLVLLAFFWSFTIYGNCLGDEILTMLKLPVWSNGKTGVHYTIFYAYLFLIPAFLLGWRNQGDLLAVTGKRLASVFLAILLVVPLFMIF